LQKNVFDDSEITFHLTLRKITYYYTIVIFEQLKSTSNVFAEIGMSECALILIFEMFFFDNIITVSL